MKNSFKGLLLGAVAGVLDLIPMISQKLTWDANVSAFIMWLVIGFFLTKVDLKMNGFLKGIVISFLVLAPSAVLIGWRDPVVLVPIIVMTAVLGSLLGTGVDRFIINGGEK